MKIKKNGKVIRLTESDLKRIVKRVITEEKVKEFALYNNDNSLNKNSVNGRIGGYTYEDLEKEVEKGVVIKVKNGFKYKPGYPKK